MRSLMIAGLAMVTIAAAGPANAQRIAPTGQAQWGGQMRQGQMSQGQMPRAPGGQMPHGPGGQMPPPQQHHMRWGGAVGGHWSGGVNAPGGWHAYRRPTRGWTLPRYWIAPTFYIGDYAAYGLSQPPYGYNWTRYYDDAVLMDQRGRVQDSVSGIDWDGYDNGYGYGYGQGGQGGYESSGYGYAQGGAGAPGYGAPYPAPHGRDYGAPPVVYAPPSEVVQGNGYTSSSYSSSAGYASGGYYFPPAITTVVTFQSAPVVTTTTTEYVETTRYVAPRRHYVAKRKWRPVRRQCSCNCCR